MTNIDIIHKYDFKNTIPATNKVERLDLDTKTNPFPTKIFNPNTSSTEQYIINETETIKIFDKTNKKNNQYGGDQMEFWDNIKELLKDEIIISKIREYYPDATLEDCEYYLRALSEVGCGYVACVNSIFVEYQGKEKEFEETFGFPMYRTNEKGKMDFNYEYLILDYFNYSNSIQFSSETHKMEKKQKSIEEVYGNKVGRIKMFFNYLVGKDSFEAYAYSGEEFSYFLKEKYNIECIVDMYTPPKIEISPNTEEYDKLFYERADKFRHSFGSQYYKSYIETQYGKELFRKNSEEVNAETVIGIYERLKKTNQQVIIGCKGYDLYQKGNPFSIQTNGKNAESGHAMYITGVTEDGKNLIVSSWGKEYILDLSKVEKRNGNISLLTIKYNEI